VPAGREDENDRTVTLFDAAIQNVFDLMERDSYVRYVRSDLFHQLTQSFKDASIVP
jgi:hypothetical protein